MNANAEIKVSTPLELWEAANILAHFADTYGSYRPTIRCKECAAEHPDTTRLLCRWCKYDWNHHDPECMLGKALLTVQLLDYTTQTLKYGAAKFKLSPQAKEYLDAQEHAETAPSA